MYDLTARFLAFKRKNVLNYIFLYTDYVTIFTDLPLISINIFIFKKFYVQYIMSWDITVECAYWFISFFFFFYVMYFLI